MLVLKLKSFFCHPNHLPLGCRMVEEFMAITNVTVAVKLSKGLPRHALLKRQPVPGKERLEDLQSQAKTMGLEIDTSNTHSIQVCKLALKFG